MTGLTKTRRVKSASVFIAALNLREKNPTPPNEVPSAFPTRSCHEIAGQRMLGSNFFFRRVPPFQEFFGKVVCSSAPFDVYTMVHLFFESLRGERNERTMVYGLTPRRSFIIFARETSSMDSTCNLDRKSFFEKVSWSRRITLLLLFFE